MPDAGPIRDGGAMTRPGPAPGFSFWSLEACARQGFGLYVLKIAVTSNKEMA